MTRAKVVELLKEIDASYWEGPVGEAIKILEQEKCENCRYWDTQEFKQPSFLGRCKGFEPINDQFYATKFDFYCAYFKARKQPDDG